jgi:hypothetical protein
MEKTREKTPKKFPTITKIFPKTAKNLEKRQKMGNTLGNKNKHRKQDRNPNNPTSKLLTLVQALKNSAN